ncbi:hypothetical protein Ddc_19212 [Ditylenchus destructor]|nr:hypothetical protein Ddc_19212 [Ditylenchus destructor]
MSNTSLKILKPLLLFCIIFLFCVRFPAVGGCCGGGCGGGGGVNLATLLALRGLYGQPYRPTTPIGQPGGQTQQPGGELSLEINGTNVNPGMLQNLFRPGGGFPGFSGGGGSNGAGFNGGGSQFNNGGGSQSNSGNNLGTLALLALLLSQQQQPQVGLGGIGGQLGGLGGQLGGLGGLGQLGGLGRKK